MSEPLTAPAAFLCRQPSPWGRRAGLTVLELVSALALFVIVLGTLMIALNTATDIWSRNTAKTRAQQSARQALDRLATDLSGAIAQASVKPEATAPLSSEEPLFIAENKMGRRIGLYFVRQLSPGEVSGQGSISLEAVAYCWTTNGLARYATPITTSVDGQIVPPVSDQLVEFKAAAENFPATSNVVASSIVQFVPLVYQPLSPAVTVSETKPLDPLNAYSDKIEIADLPDFIDVHIACVGRQTSSAASATNYITRRITLPAAQASRLP